MIDDLNEIVANAMFENLESISTKLQLDLLKGDVEWEDDVIQFFIPVILNFTNFEWLELIAEHNLIDEDEKVVKNFLAMVKSLAEVNAGRLDKACKEELR